METSEHAEAVRAPASSEATASGRARELGAFLRARRESLDPQRLGLPRIGRRRTPGLRREEVAQLARVGVTWYTWLEQGRPVQASARVLESIAAALRCSEAETWHLLALAGRGPAASIIAAGRQLSRASQAVLDQLEPLPALIQNARFDVVGCNAAFCRLVGVDLPRVPEEDRNCLYLMLTNPTWRSRLPSWDEAVARMAALFRAALAEHVGDEAWDRLLQRCLDASEGFRRAWRRRQVVGVEDHAKRFLHPRLGTLNLIQTNWWSAPRNGDRLLVLVPEEQRTARALARLAAESRQSGRARSARRGRTAGTSGG
jgi:transcriptional regulator with XRE-family HTH domain